MASDAESPPPFERIGIAGIGLIGGSIAAAVRRRWPGAHIAATDSREVLAQATGRGLIDEARGSVRDLSDRDLVMLCAPVPEIVKMLPALAGVEAVVSDVGSTKRVVLAEARRARLARFVGGHPMAGAATGGIADAEPALFDSRPWILVEGVADGPSVDRVAEFVRGLGARPARIDAERHDRAVAFVSHLPQLLATALMRVVNDEMGVTGLRIAGRGLEDMTRLAASPFDVWQGIFETNSDYIFEAIQALVATLPHDRAQLGDRPRMSDLFAEANRAHDRFRRTRES